MILGRSIGLRVAGNHVFFRMKWIKVVWKLSHKPMRGYIEVPSVVLVIHRVIYTHPCGGTM